MTDNPLVFARRDANAADEVLSGGNFHAEPVAFAADTLALAIAEIGALSERRIALLIDATLSGLPPFLVRDPGVNSGFMIAHVTAAALASENKSLAHPASVDSLPTSANQEDHVSMATFAARRLHEMATNTATIVGIELLAAAQGIDFHRPLSTSPRLAAVHRALRARVPFYEVDRILAPDIAAASDLVFAGTLSAGCHDLFASDRVTTVDMSVWQGRVDDAEGALARRWHQVMQPQAARAARRHNGAARLRVRRRSRAQSRTRRRRRRPTRDPACAAQHADPRVHTTCRRRRCRCAGDALESAQQALAATVAQHLDAGRFPLVLGGGHEMAWGSFKGLATHLAMTEGAPRVGIVNFDAHFDLRRDTRATSGTPFLQIAQDCAARGWVFRYACLGVSRYANTEALFARARELGVLSQLDESLEAAHFMPALQAFVAEVDDVYLTVCLDVLPGGRGAGRQFTRAARRRARRARTSDRRCLRERQGAAGRHRRDESALRRRWPDRRGGRAHRCPHRQRSRACKWIACGPESIWRRWRSRGPTSGYGEIRDAALAVRDGRIVWMGRRADLPAGLRRSRRSTGAGHGLLPA